MLPDYPEVKEKLQKLIVLGVKFETNRQSPFLSLIPKRPLFEGDKYIIVHEDGVAQEVEFRRIEESVSTSVEEAETVTLEEYFKQLRGLFTKMQEQKAKQTFSTLEKAAKETGNIVNGEGKPLSADNVLAILEKFEFRFDEHGKFSNPLIVIGPELEADAQKAIKKIIEEEPYKTRFAELVERKRMEWRARESNRKLVG